MGCRGRRERTTGAGLPHFMPGLDDALGSLLGKKSRRDLMPPAEGSRSSLRRDGTEPYRGGQPLRTFGLSAGTPAPVVSRAHVLFGAQAAGRSIRRAGQPRGRRGGYAIRGGVGKWFFERPSFRHPGLGPGSSFLASQYSHKATKTQRGIRFRAESAGEAKKARSGEPETTNNAARYTARNRG